MSFNDQILEALRDAPAPMTNREIREVLELTEDGASTRVSAALNVLRSKGTIERVELDEGGFGHRLATDIANAPTPRSSAPAKPAPARPPLPVTTPVAGPNITWERDPLAAPRRPVIDHSPAVPAKPHKPPAITTASDASAPARPAQAAAAPPSTRAAMGRQVYRCAAAELLIDAGDAPMSPERVAAINELVRIAA